MKVWRRGAETARSDTKNREARRRPERIGDNRGAGENLSEMSVSRYLSDGDTGRRLRTHYLNGHRRRQRRLAAAVHRRKRRARRMMTTARHRRRSIGSGHRRRTQRDQQAAEHQHNCDKNARPWIAAGHCRVACHSSAPRAKLSCGDINHRRSCGGSRQYSENGSDVARPVGFRNYETESSRHS